MLHDVTKSPRCEYPVRASPSLAYLNTSQKAPIQCVIVHYAMTGLLIKKMVHSGVGMVSTQKAAQGCHQLTFYLSNNQ